MEVLTSTWLKRWSISSMEASFTWNLLEMISLISSIRMSASKFRSKRNTCKYDGWVSTIFAKNTAIWNAKISIRSIIKRADYWLTLLIRGIFFSTKRRQSSMTLKQIDIRSSLELNGFERERTLENHFSLPITAAMTDDMLNSIFNPLK